MASKKARHLVRNAPVRIAPEHPTQILNARRRADRRRKESLLRLAETLVRVVQRRLRDATILHRVDQCVQRLRLRIDVAAADEERVTTCCNRLDGSIRHRCSM